MEGNKTHHHEVDNYIDYINVILLVTKISAISSNALILYVILKCKSARKPVDTYVINWAILNLFHILTSPGIYKWYKHIHDIYREFKLHERQYFTFEFGIVLLLSLVLLKEHMTRLRPNHMTFLVWCAVVLLEIVAIISDIFNYSVLHISVFFAGFLFLALTLLVKRVFYCMRNNYPGDDANHLELTLISAYVLYWLVVCVVVIVKIVHNHNAFLTYFFPVTLAFAESYAVTMLVILHHLDKTFAYCFYNIFKRHRDDGDCNGIVSGAEPTSVDEG